MNIGLQIQVKSGYVYIANVIAKTIMQIKADGSKSSWRPYKDLQGGQVGGVLKIYWPDGAEKSSTETSEVVKLEFPKIE